MKEVQKKKEGQAESLHSCFRTKVPVSQAVVQAGAFAVLSERGELNHIDCCLLTAMVEEGSSS
jgi:hypothetical protein